MSHVQFDERKNLSNHAVSAPSLAPRGRDRAAMASAFLTEVGESWQELSGLGCLSFRAERKRSRGISHRPAPITMRDVSTQSTGRGSERENGF